MLTIVRAAHTGIYVVMAGACFVLLYAAVTGARGAWLMIAAGLVAVEVVVFSANGLNCPLTAVAAKHAGARPDVSDTYFPERLTRHTFHVFAPLILFASILLAARFFWLGWR
jgi:hypothetical protein